MVEGFTSQGGNKLGILVDVINIIVLGEEVISGVRFLFKTYQYFLNILLKSRGFIRKWVVTSPTHTLINTFIEHLTETYQN